MSDTKTCVFCDIIAGKCPETRVEYSNDNIVIFKDIKPASDYHYLAVPKAHMENVRSLNENQRDLSMTYDIIICFLIESQFISQFKIFS